eukprot:3180592-Pleurochrysis_carterae.AAC.1
MDSRTRARSCAATQAPDAETRKLSAQTLASLSLVYQGRLAVRAPSRLAMHICRCMSRGDNTILLEEVSPSSRTQTDDFKGGIALTWPRDDLATSRQLNVNLASLRRLLGHRRWSTSGCDCRARYPNF